ncbi:MAG: VOC family protein [Clostridium sp.]|nr:VOC family protein [Clostridium sp.]
MIDHIAFVVEDPKKTADLLEKFGYLVYRETPHHGGSVEVEDPAQKGLIIELCTKRPQDTIGFNHACLRVESREEYGKMVSDGMKFKGELRLSPDSGRYINNYIDDDKIKWQITI